MSWGDTLILVISRGVQLYHGIAQSAVTCTGDVERHAGIELRMPFMLSSSETQVFW